MQRLRPSLVNFSLSPGGQGKMFRLAASSRLTGLDRRRRLATSAQRNLMPTKGPAMMLSIRYRHLPGFARRKIEEMLISLSEHCRVDHAEVVIEHRAEQSPMWPKCGLRSPGRT